jgi:adenosylcobyric acid synthase
VAQAEACGLEPHPDFNPILLKPTSDMGSQVVLHGKVWKNLRAREYYTHFDELFGEVMAAYERLAARFDYVVMEGAGSVAELNLKSRDLVNLNLARAVGAPALLVSDIDRGGIFAAIIGTIGLLEPEERALVRAFAVNRFRGDPGLFEDGVRMLEEKSGKPCLGVFPYLREFTIDEEDGVSVEDRGSMGASDVAIVKLPRISNLTDFRLLPDAAWITRPVDRQFSAVLIPGTKSTLPDLAWLRAQGLDVWIRAQHAGGARIIGVCGGYQMLGTSILDPSRADSELESGEGLGLLPVRTTMAEEKTTRTVRAVTGSGIEFVAYEIHMGETASDCDAFARVDGHAEGARLGRVTGTYLHGALEDPHVLSELLGRPVAAMPSKDEAYDGLAHWFRSHANLRLFEEQFL